MNQRYSTESDSETLMRREREAAIAQLKRDVPTKPLGHDIKVTYHPRGGATAEYVPAIKPGRYGRKQ